MEELKKVREETAEEIEKVEMENSMEVREKAR